MTLIQLDAHSGINLDRILEWSDDPATQTLYLLWDDQTRIGYRGPRRVALLATLQAHSTPAPSLVLPSREARLATILGRYLTHASGKAQLTQNLLSAAGHVLFWEITDTAEAVDWMIGEVGQPATNRYRVSPDGGCSCRQPGVWQCAHSLAVKMFQELEQIQAEAEARGSTGFVWLTPTD